MLPLASYSFADVFGTIIGPGGAIPFGMGTGQAEEGIDIEPVESKNKMTVGAGGDVMHSLIVHDAAKMTVHVLKTSPLNAAFQQMFDLQKSQSILWGKNILSLTNPALGDVYTGHQVAFGTRPRNSYAKDPNQIAWEFDIGRLFNTLGPGVPA